MEQEKIHLLKKVFLFIALLCIVDLSVGAILQKLSSVGLKRSPNASRTEHTIKEVDANLLIMGSSRANHHYISSIISDSINKTVYNCGSDGKGFDYSVAMIHAVSKRYSPEIIIVDISPILLDTNYSFGILNEIYPYYDSDKFYKELINNYDQNNRFKLLSKMYRYNNQVVPLARNIFLGDYSHDNGYAPLPNNGYLYPSLNYVEYTSSNEIDSHKKELLLYCIQRCNEKNIKLIISVSPRYQESNILKDSSYIYLKKLLEEKNIPLIYMGDNTVINDSTLYKDAAHLNHNGAMAFTKVFVGSLKEVVN